MHEPSRAINPVRHGGRHRLAVVLVLGVSAVTASGAEFRWTGAGGDWHSPFNWQPLGVPGVADRAVVDSGMASLAFAHTVGELRQGGGTISGSDLTITGPAILTGGTHGGGGTTRFDGSLAITGNAAFTLAGSSAAWRTLRAAGTTDWSGNSSTGGNAIAFDGTGANIENLGTWVDRNSFSTSLGAGPGGNHIFDNRGTYRKTGAGTTEIHANFYNPASGAVEVMAGQLTLLGMVADGVPRPSSWGSYHVAHGATLRFGRGDPASSPTASIDGSRLSGAGRVLIDGHRVSFGASPGVNSTIDHAGQLAIFSGRLEGLASADARVASFEQRGGTLANSGTLTVAGPASLLGGRQSGPGATRFEGPLYIVGGSGHTLAEGRSMLTAGTTIWDGAGSPGAIGFGGSATLTNSGTWNDLNAADSHIGQGGGGSKAFVNSGTYHKLGPGTTSVHAAFINTGTLDLAGGVFQVESADFANRGLMRGAGQIGAAGGFRLRSTGIIAPGDPVGTLTVDASLDMRGTLGALQIDLAAPTLHDRLVVSGTLWLGGSLLISSLGYVPAVGDAFAIVSYAALSSATRFVDMAWSGFGPGVVFGLDYGQNLLTLTVTAVPEPARALTLLAGLAMLAGLLALVPRLQWAAAPPGADLGMTRGSSAPARTPASGGGVATRVRPLQVARGRGSRQACPPVR